MATRDPAGREDGGAPIADWLLGSFVLPSCGAHAKAEYAVFGFSLVIPRVADGEATGRGGVGQPSATSGLITFSFDGCPFESAAVQWSTAEASAELGSVLADFAAVLERSVDRIKASGPLAEATMGTRAVLYRRFDVETRDGPVLAVVAALYCEETGRAFVICHAIHAGLSGWVDPMDELVRHVASLECYD